MPKKAIIIGAGPAGLTAAYELLKRTDIVPIILEKDDIVGGISRTIDYKGNRMDMGPHRFFSKSDRVMNWWLNIMPLEDGADKNATIAYQNKTRALNAESATPAKDPEKVMLVIKRLTRIYFLRKFFAYPIQLSLDTLRTLGFIRTIKILFSFLWIRLFPRKPEKSLEDFIINKFGKQLYLLFFKDYTEKVWGIAPSRISAEWGAQRIKGVSLSKAIGQALKSMRNKKKVGIGQKDTETSLIEQFLYPKHGPGSLWEEVARQVQEMGGRIFFNQNVKRIHIEEDKVTTVNTINSQTGQAGAWEGDYFFSTMPVQELIAGMGDSVPKEVQEVAAGLQYRDFINVGILLKKLSAKDGKPLKLKDNWIYIQERDVKVGRLMIYNNWGSGMIKDPSTTWIGMEYFCNKTDAFWAESDEAIQKFAIQELGKMELAATDDVLDITVRRMEKTYPAYFGTYEHFDKIKAFTDDFANLFLVGRNGMHKYNNADHSMLCAMVTVDNIVEGVTAKANVWSINTEKEYHESKNQPIPETKNTTVTKFRKTLLDYKTVIKQNPSPFMFAIALIVCTMELTFFKIIYPYASFINGDSYVYIQSAYYNYDINTYPIGYSKFLRLFSTFTKSDTALVVFQYFSMQIATLWFTRVITKIIKTNNFTKRLITVLIFLNPASLYISNYVSSDALFITLSFCWLTTLILFLKGPTLKLLTWHALSLFFCFIFRYNALYYPIISICVILISKPSIKFKLTALMLCGSAIILFMAWTMQQYKRLTGVSQFSPFSGWQLANNAMYAYRYVNADKYKPAPAALRNLDNMVRHYFDTTKNTSKHPEELLLASTIYMWDPRSPLQRFMNSKFKLDSLVSPAKRWASMGPLYAQYGSFLTRAYPKEFIRYFLIPNAIKYYTPPKEFLDSYNSNMDTVLPIAQVWFKYPSRKVHTLSRDLQSAVLAFLPIFSGIINAIFIFTVLAIWLLGRPKLKKPAAIVLFLFSLLWICNFSFSVLASPITLRYQLFAIFTFSIFAIVLLEQIWKAAFKTYNLKTTFI